MRSMYFGDRPKGERWKSVHEFEPVGGITLMVAEPAENPDTVNLVMLDTMEGISVVSQIDKADPAARARAIAMGETVREALETAALTWDIDDDGGPRRARTERA